MKHVHNSIKESILDHRQVNMQIDEPCIIDVLAFNKDINIDQPISAGYHKARLWSEMIAFYKLYILLNFKTFIIEKHQQPIQ